MQEKTARPLKLAGLPINNPVNLMYFAKCPPPLEELKKTKHPHDNNNKTPPPLPTLNQRTRLNTLDVSALDINAVPPTNSLPITCSLLEENIKLLTGICISPPIKKVLPPKSNKLALPPLDLKAMKRASKVPNNLLRIRNCKLKAELQESILENKRLLKKVIELTRIKQQKGKKEGGLPVLPITNSL